MFPVFFTSLSFCSLDVTGVVVAVVGVVVFVVVGVVVFGVVVEGVLVGLIGVRIMVLDTGFDPGGQLLFAVMYGSVFCVIAGVTVIVVFEVIVPTLKVLVTSPVGTLLLYASAPEKPGPVTF